MAAGEVLRNFLLITKPAVSFPCGHVVFFFRVTLHPLGFSP